MSCEEIALAMLAFLRTGTARVQVGGRQWPEGRRETATEFMRVFPRMEDRPSGRRPEMARAPRAPIWHSEEAKEGVKK